MLKRKPKKRKTSAQQRKQRFLLCFDFLFALKKHLWKVRDAFRCAVQTWNPVVQEIDHRLSGSLFACHVMHNVLKKFEEDTHSRTLPDFHFLGAAKRLCWSRDCGPEFEEVESFVLHIIHKGEVPLAWFTLPLFQTSDVFKKQRNSP